MVTMVDTGQQNEALASLVPGLPYQTKGSSIVIWGAEPEITCYTWDVFPNGCN